MDEISRRELLKLGASTVAALAIGAPASGATKGSASKPPAKEISWAYNHRAAFGPWINDMRLEPWPEGVAWPYAVLDDKTVEGIIRCLDVASWAGFNEFNVFGLFATHAWPVDIKSAIDRIKEQVQNVNRRSKKREARIKKSGLHGPLCFLAPASRICRP